MNEWMNEWINIWMNELMINWWNEWLNEWTDKIKYHTIEILHSISAVLFIFKFLYELRESKSSDISHNDDRISCRWSGRKGNHVGFHLSLIPALYDKIYWNYKYLVELWGSEIRLKKLLRNFTDQSYWYLEYVLKYYFKWVLMGFNGLWYYFYPRFHDEYDFYNFSVYLCLDVN